MNPSSPLQSLDAARAALAPLRVWVLSDGKAGDLNQCLGVAERLGLAPESRVIAPRAPWRWFMPRFWSTPFGIDPREAPDIAFPSEVDTGSREGNASKLEVPTGPLAGPLPDLVMASGRRAAAYLPAIKRASGGRTVTAFLKDPRTSPRIADFLWVPQHDGLRGDNVLVTLLSPHRLSPQKLVAARAALRPEIAALPAPRVAVLLGGDSRDFAFTAFDIARLEADLVALVKEGASLMVTPSRRTPEALRASVAGLLAAQGGYWWDGTTPNPYLEMLACADAVVVTADSVNMVGEALVTGKPVLLFRPSGGGRKIDEFLRGLMEQGFIRPFAGALHGYSYEPQDATPAVALALAQTVVRLRPELLK